jgi:hypothetical protein
VEDSVPELPFYGGPRDDSLLEFVVPNPHFNQTPECHAFCKLYTGKTFRELGFTMNKLKE